VRPPAHSFFPVFWKLGLDESVSKRRSVSGQAFFQGVNPDSSRGYKIARVADVRMMFAPAISTCSKGDEYRKPNLVMSRPFRVGLEHNYRCSRLRVCVRQKTSRWFRLEQALRRHKNEISMIDSFSYHTPNPAGYLTRPRLTNHIGGNAGDLINQGELILFSTFRIYFDASYIFNLHVLTVTISSQGAAGTKKPGISSRLFLFGNGWKPMRAL
jgi:hypothetical protein